MRLNKLSTIAQTVSFFSFGPARCRSPFPTTTEHDGFVTRIYLKCRCQRVLPYCSAENKQQGVWRGKKGRFFCNSCNHEESEAPVRSNNFEDIVSTMWREMLFYWQNSTPKTQNPKLFVAWTAQIEQLCILFWSNVEQHSFLCNLHKNTVFFKQSLSRHIVDVYRAMSLLMLQLYTAATPSVQILFRRVRFATAQRPSLPGKVDWTKQNSFWKLLLENVDRSMRCTRASFGRANASAQRGRTTKPRCKIFDFFELKKYTKSHWSRIR